MDGSWMDEWLDAWMGRKVDGWDVWMDDFMGRRPCGRTDCSCHQAYVAPLQETLTRCALNEH